MRKSLKIVVTPLLGNPCVTYNNNRNCLEDPSFTSDVRSPWHRWRSVRKEESISFTKVIQRRPPPRKRRNTFLPLATWTEQSGTPAKAVLRILGALVNLWLGSKYLNLNPYFCLLEKTEEKTAAGCFMKSSNIWNLDS